MTFCVNMFESHHQILAFKIKSTPLLFFHVPIKDAIIQFIKSPNHGHDFILLFLLIIDFVIKIKYLCFREIKKQNSCYKVIHSFVIEQLAAWVDSNWHTFKYFLLWEIVTSTGWQLCKCSVDNQFIMLQSVK